MLRAGGQVTVALLRKTLGGDAPEGRSSVSAMTRRLRLTTAASLTLLAALALGGCSAGASDSATDSGGPAFGGDSGGESFDAPAAEEAALDGEVSDGRSVITTGQLYLTVAAPLEAAEEAARITERAGGRVDGRTEYSPDQGRYAAAELLLRLPSATLTETLEELRALGEVEELTLQTDDVTREVQDLDARITALRSSVERLLALQDAAATVEDLIDLETAISDRQGQLESLEAQQRYLADQVDLSTLRLTLGSDATAPVDEPDTFLTGLIAGWESLVAVGSGLLVIAGVLLPWLAVLGVLALVTLLVVRGARRRRGRAADQAPAAGASTTSA